MRHHQTNDTAIKISHGLKNLDLVKEYRCPVCKRLLMKGKIITIETRCPKCKRICIIRDP